MHWNVLTREVYIMRKFDKPGRKKEKFYFDPKCCPKTNKSWKGDCSLSDRVRWNHIHDHLWGCPWLNTQGMII